MIFKRRKHPPIHLRLRNTVWPQAGWHRSSRYIGHRVMRLSGSPYSIAAGFACGAAISFTPFVGFHFILGGLWAWLIRSNILASAIGTAVGNPWTFPFIWVWVFNLGTWMMGGNSAVGLPDEFAMTYIFDHPLQIFLPMLLGAVPTAAVVWVVSYFPLRSVVAKYQAHRSRKLEAARQNRDST